MKYLLILLCLTPWVSSGQGYPVLEAKKVFTIDKNRVKKGDVIDKQTSLTVSEKGFLTLDVESAMHLRLGPGSYDVSDEAKRHNAWYAKHLELTNFLKWKGLLGCKFKYKTLVVPGSNRHYEIDRIELDQKGLIKIKKESDSIVIKWNNPEYKYNGKYFIIVRDFYNNGFVDVIETEAKTITLFPAKYGHRHLFYNIIAENCRASLRYKLEILTVKPFTARETNYLDPDQ